MIKALFFDFDGTISQTKDIVEKTFFEVLDKLDFEYNKFKIKKLFGIKTEEILEKIGIKEDKIKEKIKKIYYKSLLEKIYLNHLSLCSSLKPLYKLKKDYLLIIVSNSEEIFLKAAIKKLKIINLFKEIYGANSFSSKDKALKKIFKKYKIKPREAIYIGDRFSDIIYAKKAGCYSVAIHNDCSWSSLNEIKKYSPDFIIKNFEDLKKIIKKINKNKR